MPECELAISLDQPSPEPGTPRGFGVGESIEGLVTIRVPEGGTCRGLEVALVLRKRGLGFAPPPAEVRQAVEGTWSEGAHTARFRLPAPAAPATYDGRELGWSWWLEATAEDQDVVTVADEEEVVLQVPESRAIEVAMPEPGSADAVGTGRGGIAGLVVTFVVAAAAAAVGIALRGDGEVFEAMSGLGGLVALGAGVLLGMALLDRRTRAAKDAVGDPQLALREDAGPTYRDSASAGPTLSVVAWVRPGAHLAEATCALVVEEHSRSKSTASDHISTHHSLVHRTVVSLEEAEPGEWRGALPLPTHGVPESFEDSRGHGVRWRLALEVTPAGHGGPLPAVTAALRARWT